MNIERIIERAVGPLLFVGIAAWILLTAGVLQ